jgi:hypothetical protein
MSVSSVSSASNSVPFVPEREESRVQKIALMAAQLAIRILFVVGFTLLTMALTPLSFHAVLLPSVFCCTAVLSLFFFNQDGEKEAHPLVSPSTPNEFISLDSPVSSPVQDGQVRPLLSREMEFPSYVDPNAFDDPLPPYLPSDAPRGVYNQGNNCAFNSVIQLLKSDPKICEWVRKILPQGNQMEAFDDFFREYNVSEDALNAFHQFAAENPLGFRDAFERFISVDYPHEEECQAVHDLCQFLSNPEHPIPAGNEFADWESFLDEHCVPANYTGRFREFFEQKRLQIALEKFVVGYQPEGGDRVKFDTIKGVLKIQNAFRVFFEAYSRAEEKGKKLVNSNSQRIRVALSQLEGSQIHASSSYQEDAFDILRILLDFLPDRQKFSAKQAIHLNTFGLPAIAGSDIAQRDIPVETIIPLELNPQGSLLLAFQNYIQNTNLEGNYLRCRDVEGTMRDYPINRVELSFINVPSALRLQIKRTQFEMPEPREGWFGWFWDWWSGSQGRAMKNSTPIDVPLELNLPIVDRAPMKYVLNSFVNHLGDSPNSGHYTSYRAVGGHYYHINDREVTLLSQEAWMEAARGAYLLCYLPQPG